MLPPDSPLLGEVYTTVITGTGYTIIMPTLSICQAPIFSAWWMSGPCWPVPRLGSKRWSLGYRSCFLPTELSGTFSRIPIMIHEFKLVITYTGIISLLVVFYQINSTSIISISILHNNIMEDCTWAHMDIYLFWDFLLLNATYHILIIDYYHKS